MKIIYQYLVTIATIVPTVFALTCCNKIKTCEVQDEKAYSESVQASNSVYSRVFGTQKCSPHKIILRIPVNFKIEDQKAASVTSQSYQPKVTTVVTFSREYKTFYIRRIDQDVNGAVYYSQKDSCLAWKWSRAGEQAILSLSLERNLQIRDPNIKNIIFIISLPVEIKEAESDIALKRYTWDRVGDIYNFDLKKEYSILKDALRSKEKLKAEGSDAFVDGKKVNDEMAKELSILSIKGGVHLDEDIASMLDTQFVENYIPGSESSSCEIPADLKKS